MKADYLSRKDRQISSISQVFQSYHTYPPPNYFTMSFHLTGQDIHVEDGHILVARLQDENGDWQESSIDLDQLIGNKNGMLQLTRTASRDSRANMSRAHRQLPLGRRELQPDRSERPLRH